MVGVVTCSIVVADRGSGINRCDLAAGRSSDEARGLISISEDSLPQATPGAGLRSVISIEATNAESIRWYAREILGLDRDHPAWHDMERQIATSDARERMAR